MKKSKIISACVAVLATMTLFTGCNKRIFDFNYTFDKAVVTVGDTKMVYDIVNWDDYEGEQLQIELKDGSVLLVSSFNTVLIHTNSNGSSLILENLGLTS